MAARTPASSRLPHLVWHGIIAHLSDSLETLLKLASTHTTLKDLCRSAISSHFRRLDHPVPPLPKTHYYHALLHLILQDYVDPAAILEFHFPDQYHYSRPLSSKCLPISRPGLQNQTLAQVDQYDRRYREALSASAFIPDDLLNEITIRFQRGDQDAALVVLLPLCTKLKVLEPPVKGELCAALFQSVGQAYAKLNLPPEAHRAFAYQAAKADIVTEKQGRRWNKAQPAYDLPFSELLILNVNGHSQGFSHLLHKSIPYMCLPSLHRIILTNLRDRKFFHNDSETLILEKVVATKITCPSIYFSQSSVSSEVAMAFADMFLTSGCEIMQWFEHDVEDWMGPSEFYPFWDHIVVKAGDEGKKVVEKRLDWDGGNPGYAHAWVSWLFHGKMADWKRVGRPFALEEGDMDEEWLSGAFG